MTNTREHETICSNKTPLSDICNRQTPTSDNSRVPLHVKNDTPLTADEVLLYALMIVSFPTGTFYKKHSAEKYDNIVQAVHQVTGVNYSSHSVRNYFHQVGNNQAKGIRKTKGLCRWNYLMNDICKFVHSEASVLQSLV